MCMFIYLFVVYFSFAPVISTITHLYCELFYIQVLTMVIITETLTSTSHHDIFTYLDYIFSCYLHIYIYIYIYIYIIAHRSHLWCNGYCRKSCMRLCVSLWERLDSLFFIQLLINSRAVGLIGLCTATNCTLLKNWQCCILFMAEGFGKYISENFCNI